MKLGYGFDMGLTINRCFLGNTYLYLYWKRRK